MESEATLATSRGGRPSRLLPFWATALVSGAAGVAIVVFWTVYELKQFRVFPPWEDAAMLFRYAQNLADGSGIVWNVGEAPGVSDGATDLGFVLTLAPLIAVGVSPPLAAMLINFAAVFAMGVMVDLANRVFLRAGLLGSLFITAVIASGPLQRYIPSGFSAPVFGALLMAAGLAAALACCSTAPRRRLVLAATAGLLGGLSGWWRPEGFLLAGLVILAVAWAGSRRDGVARTGLDWPEWGSLLGVAFAVSLAFVIFRLTYFGQMLPTSAVMKGGALDVHNATNTAQFYLVMTLPIVAVLVALAISRPTRIWAFVFLLVTAASTWIVVTLVADWWDRMQWPAVPALVLVAMLAMSPVAVPATRLSPGRILGALLVGGLTIFSWHMIQGPNYGYAEAQPHTEIADALKTVDTKDLRLAISEAGLIPLAIQGQALDTYGLNNRSIAESQRATLPSELERFAPNLIIVQGATPASLTTEDCATEGNFDSEWGSMIRTVYDYAEASGFQIVRSIQTAPCLAFTVFASQETPPQVLEAIKNAPAAGGPDLPIPAGS